MSDPVLYHFAFDPASRSVRLALGEAKLSVVETPVRPWEDDCPVGPLNPSGMPPVLQVAEHGRLLMHWPKMVYHFHREGFSLPHGAKLLATGDVYPNQAFRYGENAWGVQFHAELTRAMMHRWVVHGAHRFVLPNAQQGREHLEGRMIFDAPLRAWLWDFLELIFERDQRAS